MQKASQRLPDGLVFESAEIPLLDQIFDRIAHPTFVIDKDHRITHWNKALEVLSGLKSSDMVGSHDQWRPFYGQPRPTLADLIVEASDDDGVATYYRNKFRRNELLDGAYEAEDFFPECGDDGEWLHFTAASIRDENGNILGAIETLINITARKQAEQALIRREKKYRELSITDNLTSLFNSRHFYERLEEEHARCDRHSHSMSLCILDIDDFKAINDEHGHLFGDKVLETVGHIIRREIRTQDTGYRYGGEEFTVLLPDTAVAGAIQVIERIRSTIEEMLLHHEHQPVQITISAGIAQWQAKSDSGVKMLKRADEALYRAKQNGKNRIEQG